MKKLALLLFLTITLLGGSGLLLAQSVTISPNGTGPIIEANATTKGILPPRMTMSQRAALTPTVGLQVYCNDCSPAGPYSYNGTSWVKMFDYQTTSGPCATYTVGQQAQGGTVFWVDDSGQHGLVAAPEDYSNTVSGPTGTFIQDWYPWSINSVIGQQFTYCQKKGIYGGAPNSEKIVQQNNWGEYAAFLCGLKDWSGYGDWYLPAIGELIILYTNRNLLPVPLKVSSANDAISKHDIYWSSSESSSTTAFAMVVSQHPSGIAGNLPIGAVTSIEKWKSIDVSTTTPIRVNMHVRAIRRF